jgi:hypothetical protein
MPNTFSYFYVIEECLFDFSTAKINQLHKFKIKMYACKMYQYLHIVLNDL